MATALNMCLDGKEENLLNWISRQQGGIYRDIGKRTWRVPPVRFNSQKFREQKTNPLEKKLDCKVIETPKLTDQETNRVENYVCGAFESLSESMEKNGSAMFLITNFEYDNYLNKLNLSHLVTETNSVVEAGSQRQATEPAAAPESPDQPVPKPIQRRLVKLPRDVAKRGELDILVLHQEAGIVLVQTKAVGYNFQLSEGRDISKYKENLSKAIEKAGEQLSRDRHVMLHVMEDLKLTNEQITSVIALPNLPREVLQQALELWEPLKCKIMNDFCLDPELNILCEEDFKKEITGHYVALENWWRESLIPQANGLTLANMEQIAYRTVGLLSTVSVWTMAQPRMEVRNLNDAASETGNRYTQMVLSAQQVELLTREDKYFYLWGPAGSGKTLLLSLKGRQWLRHRSDVAVLNTRLGSRGRKVGVVMQETINKVSGLEKTAKRIDLDLMKDEAALLEDILLVVKPDDRVNFLIDEVTWVEETEKMISLLQTQFPNSAIWCAGMLEECLPKGFESGGLHDILRCPPSVQRVLRVIDTREERCELYLLDSAKAGLPTDGPPPFFIIHSLHGDPSIQPYDCKSCAEKLADFLLNKLNMTVSGSQKHQSASQKTYNSKDKESSQSEDRNQPAITMTRDNKSSDSGCCSGGELDGLDPDQVGNAHCGDALNNLAGSFSPHEACRHTENGDACHIYDQSGPPDTMKKSCHQNSKSKRSRRKKGRNTDSTGSNKSTSPDRPNPNVTKTKTNTKRVAGRNIPSRPQAGQRLHFSDAVLPATVPKEWHHYNKRGNWCISKEALSQSMLFLGSGPFCQHLMELGIPFKVEEQMVLEGKETENCFALCPVGAVHGLEYKVVVCVPSARALPKYTKITEHIQVGNMGQTIQMKRTKAADEILRKEEERKRTGLTPEKWFSVRGDGAPRTDKIRISTHVADEDDPPDVLYERINELDMATPHDSSVNSGTSLESQKSQDVLEMESSSSQFQDNQDLARNSTDMCERHSCGVTDMACNSANLVQGLHDRSSLLGSSAQQSQSTSQNCCTCAGVSSSSMSQKSPSFSPSSQEFHLGQQQQRRPPSQQLSSTASSPSTETSPSTCSSLSSPFSPWGTPFVFPTSQPSNAATSVSSSQASQLSSSSSTSSNTENIMSTTPHKPLSPLSEAVSTSLKPRNEVADTQMSIQQLKEEVCGRCDKDNCVCKYFEPCELEALHRLDPWDKAYLLMCASRCTSQLILVLP